MLFICEKEILIFLQIRTEVKVVQRIVPVHPWKTGGLECSCLCKVKQTHLVMYACLTNDLSSIQKPVIRKTVLPLFSICTIPRAKWSDFYFLTFINLVGNRESFFSEPEYFAW